MPELGQTLCLTKQIKTMAEFLRPSKRSLTNAQHFEFIDAFITVLVEANFTAAKIVALLNSLRNVFSEEDRWYMIARASEIIARRDAADKSRDNYYSRLFAIIRAWAGSGMANLDAAATALLRPFNLYKVKTGAQIDEESGQLDNLITDLTPAAMQAHLSTLGVTWLYEQMVAAHQEVKSYRLEQGQEESEKVAGALRKARQACDAVYDELTYLIEAFAKTADDPTPYEAFIRKWNGSLKIYQDMLNRKSGTSSSGGSGGDTPTPTPTPDGGDDGGDTPTPTPDPTPDPEPTPDPTPDPDPTPGGGGNGGTDDGTDES